MVTEEKNINDDIKSRISEGDSWLLVIFEGKTANPKETNFHQISAHTLLALGEYFSLKARQMIVAAETPAANTVLQNMERQAQNKNQKILTPDDN